MTMINPNIPRPATAPETARPPQPPDLVVEVRRVVEPGPVNTFRVHVLAARAAETEGAKVRHMALAVAAIEDFLSNDGYYAGCSGPPETCAAWMRAYADRIAPATRVRYLGTHPTHEQGEADR